MKLTVSMALLALALGAPPAAVSAGDAPKDAKCCAAEKAAKCNMSPEECAKKCPAGAKPSSKDAAPSTRPDKPAKPAPSSSR